MRCLAAISLTAGCAPLAPIVYDAPGPPIDDLPLADISLALEWNHGIRVYTGTGKVRLEVKAEIDDSRKIDFLHDRYYAEAYMAAALRPDGSEVATIRCSDLAVYSQGNHWFPERCDLVSIDLNTGERRVLFESPDGRLISSPAWSPDGASLALFVGTDVVIIDVASGGAKQVPAVKWQASRLLWPDPLQWGEDGQQIFILSYPPDPPMEGNGATGSGFQRHEEDVAVIEVASGKVKWLQVGKRLWLASSNTPDMIGDLAERLAELMRQDRPERRRAIEALVGSPDHPVSDPVWSPGRRYFFYVVRGQTWFSKTYVEGYDRVTYRTFQVKTLDRHIYAE